MQRNDLVRLQHMLDGAREAAAFLAGRSREELQSDRMLTLALIRCLEIVGEAASKVSEDTQELLREIPWSHIVGMRKRLIHAYFDINLDILWQTVVGDLPPLIDTLERIVRCYQGVRR
jgi:uncharacterized protein with HEPN domain